MSNREKVHTIGAPLAHASAPYVNKAWKRYANIAALNRPNVTVLRGKATYFDSQNQVATYEDATLGATRKERYDYLVVATGLRRTWPICPEALVENGYRDDAHSYIAQIKNARLGVVVIGGGKISPLLPVMPLAEYCE